jgi:serine/threonine-protein kinase
MAKTYRATAKDKPGELICLKLMHTHLCEDDEFVKMFIDEASIVLTLDHPNIVAVFDFDHLNGQYYLAMELVEGRDVKQIMERSHRRKTRLSPAMTAVVISDVCKALDYVHRRTHDGKPLDIIHRDISPHNVMVSFTGEVKLTDFGIAKAASRLSNTKTGAVKGKRGYMSPEQARGANIDARSDIFAAGILMHELLTGSRLFYADSAFEVFEQILERDIPRPSEKVEVDADLETICLKALQRDRDKRYPTAGAMGEALDAWIAAMTPGRDKVGLDKFTRTLFDLEEGDLPTVEPVISPEEAAVADLPTDLFNLETNLSEKDVLQVASIAEWEAVDSSESTVVVDIDALLTESAESPSIVRPSAVPPPMPARISPASPRAALAAPRAIKGGPRTGPSSLTSLSEAAARASSQAALRRGQPLSGTPAPAAGRSISQPPPVGRAGSHAAALAPTDAIAVSPTLISSPGAKASAGSQRAAAAAPSQSFDPMAEASLPDDVDGEMEHDPTTVSAGLDAEEVPPPPRHADLQTEVSLVDGGGDFEVGSTVVTDSPTFDGPAPSMAVPPTYDGPSPPMADADDPTTDFAKPQDVDEAPDTIQPTGEESQPGAPVADWEGARPVIAVQAPPPRRPTHPDSIPPIEPRRDEDEDDEDEDDDLEPAGFPMAAVVVVVLLLLSCVVFAGGATALFLVVQSRDDGVNAIAAERNSGSDQSAEKKDDDRDDTKTDDDDTKTDDDDTKTDGDDTKTDDDDTKTDDDDDDTKTGDDDTKTDDDDTKTDDGDDKADDVADKKGDGVEKKNGADKGAEAVPSAEERARLAAERQKRLEKARLERAYLAVEVSPWADVFVDGKKLGRTPLKKPLKPGTYTVTLQNSELKRAAQKTVTVKKGETARVGHKF